MQTLSQHGLLAAKSELILTDERLFLEVERFDRIGASARRGVLALTALDAEFVGRLTSWTDTVDALQRQRRVRAGILERVRWLQLFGALIGNTDMHHGNLAFYVRGTEILDLTPAYDMVPMLYAPVHGRVEDGTLDPPLPVPADAAVWEGARTAAIDFWLAASHHPVISGAFHRIAASNAEALAKLADVSSLLPQGSVG